VEREAPLLAAPQAAEVVLVAQDDERAEQRSEREGRLRIPPGAKRVRAITNAIAPSVDPSET